MAAYAALVSFSNLIEQIHLYRPSVLAEQKEHVEILCTKIHFLQEFLETHTIASNETSEALECRIMDVIYAAEDVIESRVVDDIHARRLKRDEEISFIGFEEGIRKAIQDMDLIEKELMEIKEKDGTLEFHQPRDPSRVDSFRAPLNMKDIVVGIDDSLDQIMDKLTRCQPSYREVIPITGMGGIGKTTLAKQVYENPVVEKHFDIRRWVTISETYSVENILSDLLGGGFQSGEKLHKYLSGRRYFILLDDIWNTEVWDKLQLFFPDNNNGSRVVITSRLSDSMTRYFGSSVYEMNLLKEDKSWELLCAKVFPQESCPPELEEIGREIARKCQGLPLSISVIGGLLARNKMTLSYWESVAKDISTAISMDEKDRCMGVLALSYMRLPVNLKPCFLYLGIFPEDKVIRVSELIRLWVSEGFIKPSKGKIMEDVAMDCLKDLIGRSLVFMTEVGATGNIKGCKIHDLLRDLSIREAKRENFLHSAVKDNKEASLTMKSSRRIVDKSDQSENPDVQLDSDFQSVSFPRSLICTSTYYPRLWSGSEVLKYKLLNTRLLRILSVGAVFSPRITFDLVNLRFICFAYHYREWLPFDSIGRLWNLQTLVIRVTRAFVAPPEFWEMKCLRHIIVHRLTLPDPPQSQSDEDSVLGYLQTISCIEDFRCTDEVVRRIPNIKKLELFSKKLPDDFLQLCLDNLIHLNHLQSLKCEFRMKNCWPGLQFPESLRKLKLSYMVINWQDVTTKIGELPNLEKLVLMRCHMDETWELVEDGQFLSLKHMTLERCNLTSWIAESVHFPCLGKLVLSNMDTLVEIPYGIGEIYTLQYIGLRYCSKSVVESARSILNEQQKFGNQSFRLSVEPEE